MAASGSHPRPSNGGDSIPSSVRLPKSFRSIQSTVQGLEPEQVLVLETIGEHVQGLGAKAASQIPGMEWLAEMDVEDIAPEAGFEDDTYRQATALSPVCSDDQPAGNGSPCKSLERLVSRPERASPDRTSGPSRIFSVNLREIFVAGVQKTEFTPPVCCNTLKKAS